MRLGTWRRVALALILAGAAASTASADLFHNDIPRLAPAYDVNTGGEFMAPPVPYGHYAKDPGAAVGKAFGLLHGGLGGNCGRCGGRGSLLGGKCGHCGGSGKGCGLCGNGGHKLFGGCGGLGCGDKGCGGLGCGDKGCGLGKLKHRHGGDPCGDPGCGATLAASGLTASPQVAVAPSPQGAVTASSQSACGMPGCGLGKHHGRAMTRACDPCGGRGCGLCGGRGFSHGDACDGCGGLGNGCGKCGGCGLLNKLGSGCGACGGKGCGKCGLLGKLCSGCGGKGCGLCGGGSKLLGLFHHQKVKYFVGAGGPVPITPGYVPYVVTTRSPRDYFAFPPFSTNLP